MKRFLPYYLVHNGIVLLPCVLFGESRKANRIKSYVVLNASNNVVQNTHSFSLHKWGSCFRYTCPFVRKHTTTAQISPKETGVPGGNPRKEYTHRWSNPRLSCCESSRSAKIYKHRRVFISFYSVWKAVIVEPDTRQLQWEIPRGLNRMSGSHHSCFVGLSQKWV